MAELQFHVNAGQAQRELDAILQRLQRTRPLMAGISAELLSETEAQFGAQGNPKWQALAAATIAARTKVETWPGMILQVSTAGLAASVHTEHSDSTASIGAGAGKSAAYAAIHQFGGQAGRGRKVTIPARPYLPLEDGAGGVQLLPKTERAITAMALQFVENGRPA